ncbi:hypothetical protein DL89DRAFT_103240 [Linderina pennispora]|uniref:Secreted protein n=1 Tax=Linderina pennispora TaxID=61395 RepID=A0A1Y1WF77_9FUNG|nr:uncharacterized protein DL89DRAFT_103240 [Linderina pennispora]ORX71896.1 hypothetical protein DL89DRAFT_103240 [Linderina pennispora]
MLCNKRYLVTFFLFEQWRAVAAMSMSKGNKLVVHKNRKGAQTEIPIPDRPVALCAGRGRTGWVRVSPGKPDGVWSRLGISTAMDSRLWL